MAKQTYKAGDKVTCLHAVEAYYSNYGPNKGRVIMFNPGTVGTVAAIIPKVTIPPNPTNDPRYDRGDELVLVDYLDERNETQRVSLNFCNVKQA